MLEELTTMIGPIFSDKGLDAACGRRSPASAPRIYSDRDKLRQILKNFLSNAAKFTDSGTVTIALAPASRLAR
jgi:signal transduction histidine kinase